MSRPSYEMHLTFDQKDSAALQAFSAENPTWVYSQIDGDPVLGPGSKCYLSGHDTNVTSALRRISSAEQHLCSRGIGPIRSKIELIIYDTKTGVGL